jgi:hypothetical protein
MGSDLTERKREAVYKTLDYEARNQLSVTNDEERAYLEGHVPDVNRQRRAELHLY